MPTPATNPITMPASPPRARPNPTPTTDFKHPVFLDTASLSLSFILASINRPLGGPSFLLTPPPPARGASVPRRPAPGLLQQLVRRLLAVHEGAQAQPFRRQPGQDRLHLARLGQQIEATPPLQDVSVAGDGGLGVGGRWASVHSKPVLGSRGGWLVVEMRLMLCQQIWGYGARVSGGKLGRSPPAHVPERGTRHSSLGAGWPGTGPTGRGRLTS